jgi:type III secretion protein C
MQIIANFVAAAVLATACLGMASAAPAAWLDKKFVYRADGKKLTEVFQDFAASQSVPVVVDPAVEGSVSASFSSSSESFLKAMGKTYGVIWYFDGVTLFVYPSRAMQSRVFRLRGFDRNQVREALNSFGLGDTRFPLRFNDADQTVFAYGPPRHIELVAGVMETLEQSSKERAGGTLVVVPLKYAVAADRVSGSSRLPGLVSTLNSVFGGGAGGSSDTIESARTAAASVVGSANKQRSLEQAYGFKPGPSDNNADRGSDSKERDKGRGGDGPAKATGPEGRPVFQADEATNSVIIYAAAERIKQYEALLRQLDVAQDLVEIEATIIDVSTDEFEALGVEWDYTRNGRGAITVAPGSNPIAGANITTLLTDAGQRLLSRIRALEGNGKARIVARPKVLGSANRTATMMDKRVASVKVAGNLDVNLFTIEAGTTLQVQPQIIAHADRREVKLTLFIEDGNFESTGVDQVPIVKRTEIRTEATMREGESLLIGGISVETDTTGRSGLPGLSRVPLLGALFRNEEGSKRRSERLFLLTPKIINIDGARTAAGSAPTSIAAPPAAAPSAAAPSTPQAAAARPLSAECAASALGLPDRQCGGTGGLGR